jgi:addiction module HigA family antidote
VATRKLTLLDAAHTLEFLRSPPDNRLEALRGSRSGQYGIRVNDQFRICFRWTDKGPTDVEIVENGMRPVHPGEVLREEFLKPAGLTANGLARALKVPAPRINDIVRLRRGISADTALRLARYFGGDARSWLNLQTVYDLRVAEISSAKRVAKEVQPAAA